MTHYFLSCSMRDQHEPTTDDPSKVTCPNCQTWVARFNRG